MTSMSLVRGMSPGSPLQASGGPPAPVCRCGQQHSAERWHPQSCFGQFQRDLAVEVPEFIHALPSDPLTADGVIEAIETIFERHAREIRSEMNSEAACAIAERRRDEAIAFARRCVAAHQRAKASPKRPAAARAA